jgi:hypothetical protein
MAIKLYRCSNMWVKIGGHPCWRVQKALDEQGIAYEVVKGPFRRGSRDELEALSGQRQYPVIVFEDGSIYREQSAQMAATIAAGQLDSKRRGGGAATETAPPPAPDVPDPEPMSAPPADPLPDEPDDLPTA